MAGTIPGAGITTPLTLTTSDNTDTLTLKSTDADENSGPNLRLYRNSGSPAVGDNLGQIDFEGRNDNSQDVVYASMMARARDETDGTEDGGFQIDVMQGGTLRGLMKYYSDGAAQELSFNDDSIDVDFRVESDGNTHMLFVDGGNNVVGIGTSTPNSYNDYANNLVVYENGHAGITIVAGTSNNSSLYFADGTSGNEQYRGWVDYAHSDDALRLATSATERFRIASNGDLTATDTSIASNSDSRLKENIADYTYDISKFKQFQAKTFDWKNPEEHNGKTNNRGFIAQEVAAIDNYWTDQIPIDSDKEDAKLITADSDGKHNAYTLKLGKKDAMYVSVIQQLITKIETLETKVKALEDA